MTRVGVGVYPERFKNSPKAFWDRVDCYSQAPCAVWTGSRKPQGYGQVTWEGRKGRTAHSVAWELTFGRPVPKGLHLDHTCNNKLCCHPGHLELVTVSENVRRGYAMKQRTHCPNGHPCGPGRCRECRRAYVNQWREARRARGMA